MAAPNSDGPRDANDRAQRIAELAAQLTLIQSRDATADAERAGPGTEGAGPAHHEGFVGGDSSAGIGVTSTLAPVAAVGSSGSRARHRSEPGGHPEDPLGDPESLAKAICLRLLTGSARPRAGLATALRQRGIPDDVAEKVLDRFTELGLIDDRAYADMFVAAKHRDRALGITALRTELRRKGVDEVIADAAVRTVDQDAERERAQALIARRVDAAMANGEATARRRLVGLLARRGYSAELSRSVVDDALAKYGAEESSDWLD